MATGRTAPQSSTLDQFVVDTIQQYRAKLLDLSNRNPLISFRHSERSRSHIRIVDEIPEKLFERLATGRKLWFDGLTEPEQIPADELLPLFDSAFRKAKRDDQDYKQKISTLGPSPSDRQKQKLERELRNRVRQQLGLAPYEPTRNPPKRAVELGINPEYELPLREVANKRKYHDLRVQTLFFQEDLDRKLSGMRESARTLLQDAGLSALYCSFGFLEYYESEASDEKRIAPLVFFPIEIDRELDSGVYKYFIKGRNDDVEINVALKELLKNYGVQIPDWIDDETDANPLGTYLSKIDSAIRGKKDWLVRRYVTVGLFTFSTLAMYKDLDPQHWPAESPLQAQSLIRSLIAGQPTHDITLADDYNIDQLPNQDLLLITDADSSQHSAVIDVLAGKNTVIQGPPGTGKSQTITNIIAAALNAGKSVLFVAEKMAALEVVQSRLQNADLDPFLLEVHSSKTSKSVVAESLRSRLECRKTVPNRALLTSNLEALRVARTELIYYVQRSNEPVGSTGLTVREILLGSATRDRLRDKFPSQITSARFADAVNITPHMRQELNDAAANLETQLRPVLAAGTLSQHPWRGIRAADLTAVDVDVLFEKITKWKTGLDAILAKADDAGRQTGFVLPRAINEVVALCEKVQRFPQADERVSEALFQHLRQTSARDRLRTLIPLIQGLGRSLSELHAFVRDPKKCIEVGADALRSASNNIALSAPGLSIAQAAVQSKALTDFLEELSLLQPILSRLLDTIRLSRPSCVGAHAAVSAAQQMLELPRPLWRYRSENVLNDLNADLLKKAATRIEQLRSRRREIGKKWTLNLVPSSEKLQEMVVALRSTGAITAIFNSQCRAAKRIHKIAATQPNQRLSRSQLADELTDCFQLLEDEKKLAADQALKDACAPYFRDLETEIDALVAVNEWSNSTRALLSSLGESGRECRDVLFTADTDKLRALAFVAESEDFAKVKALLAALPKDETALSEFQQGVSERIQEMNSVLDVLRGATVIDSATSLDCDILIRAVRESASMMERVAETAKETALPINQSPWELINDSETLQRTMDYADSVAAALPEFCEFLFDGTSNLVKLKSHTSELLGLCSAAIALQAEAAEAGQIDPAEWCDSASFGDASINVLIRKCAEAAENPASIYDYINFLVAEDAAADAGLGPVLKAYSDSKNDYFALKDAADFVFFRSAAEQILGSDAKLKRHSGSSHEQLRTRFRQLDREYLMLRRQLLAALLLDKAVPSGNWQGRVGELTQMGLVQRISGQSRPRIPLRELFARAGDAIKALKPCWLMSPMSVAQFLEPGKIDFDIVIMDEASQIRPEGALGALARAKQLVIVGDQMQLPPTAFFQKISLDGSGDGDDSEFEEVRQESVLEASAARFYPVRRLKWHYRSEHGSLISFSNQEFYNGDLTVFPSPFHEHPDYGLKLIEVDGTYSTGTNPDEADAIIKAAEEFMAVTPERSLGIVAINSKQADLIRERTDQLFANSPEAEAYRARWATRLEQFFVKNLENVQGDERDVIFISTVYGKDGNGNFFQRFGPINSVYGHRRLNVLFTRAKKQLIVFSSMNPADIQDAAHPGVKVLREYLRYAKSGIAVPISGIAGQCDSEFEEWVLETLQKNGFEVVPQLGFAGYRIDLAVRDPRGPGTFLCGIECDGATYHSARSVRERDRLRQEILERLGWNIYRIWSTDWFRNPALQEKNLINHLRQLAS